MPEKIFKIALNLLTLVAASVVLYTIDAKVPNHTPKDVKVVHLEDASYSSNPDDLNTGGLYVNGSDDDNYYHFLLNANQGAYPKIKDHRITLYVDKKTNTAYSAKPDVPTSDIHWQSWLAMGLMVLTIVWAIANTLYLWGKEKINRS